MSSLQQLGRSSSTLMEPSSDQSSPRGSPARTPSATRADSTAKDSASARGAECDSAAGCTACAAAPLVLCPHRTSVPLAARHVTPPAPRRAARSHDHSSAPGAGAATAAPPPLASMPPAVRRLRCGSSSTWTAASSAQSRRSGLRDVCGRVQKRPFHGPASTQTHGQTRTDEMTDGWADGSMDRWQGQLARRPCLAGCIDG
eukprot:365850-Chlamydomonas_euryale.AAC.6